MNNFLPTQSLGAAREKILPMGRMFFSGHISLGKVNYRLYPLLVGPTGSGKTTLVTQIAKELGAELFRACRSDWIVQGASAAAGRSTVFRLLDLVCSAPRVVFFVDELDKFDAGPVTSGKPEWTTAIHGDLFNILEGRPNIIGWLGATTFPDREKPPSAMEMEERLKNVWMIGGGAFQSLFEQRRALAMGFQGSAGGGPPPMSDEVLINSGTIGPELIYRFNADICVLSYPDEAETTDLLKNSGIADLAVELGMNITTRDVDWRKGGMRALETIATRLALEKFKRNRVKPKTRSRLQLPLPNCSVGQT